MDTTATSAKRFAGFPHVLRAQQFEPEDLDVLFLKAEQIRRAPSMAHGILEGRRVAVLFEEPSTRTYHSFIEAAERLGARVRGEQHMAAFSSEVKGESVGDTVRTFLCLGVDYFVMRRKAEGSVERAAQVAGTRHPVINAGDGAGQHPTQALLDAYTIWRQFGTLDRHLHVVLVGDLKNGRTVHSLVYLLSKYPNVRFTLVSPDSHRMKPGIIEHLIEHGRTFAEHTDGSLAEIAAGADVLYVTRPQLEREADDAARQALLDRYEPFFVTAELVQGMPPDSIVMHPLPRNAELPTEIDADPRAQYFQQMENGLWIRMALLATIAEGMRSANSR